MQQLESTQLFGNVLTHSPAKNQPSCNSPEARLCPSRVLGGWGSFALVAGSMLGIGIFVSPPLVARSAGSPGWFILLWLVGGLTALGGAVACAELGAMVPKCGGDFVIQKRAYGSSVAFASGWTLFAAVFGGSIAALASGLCSFQLPVLVGMDLEQPMGFVPITRAQFAAVVLVFSLTAINHLGARLASGVQVVVTIIPITAALVAAVLLFGADSSAVTQGTPMEVGIAGLAAAYLPVYFAYSGWNGAIYLAGEVRNPSKNIPRALIAGTVAITVLYVALCFGYLRVFGIGGLASVDDAGVASASSLFGRTGEIAMALLVAVALLASLNASILGSSRIAHAMARDGALWAPLAALRRGVPTRALWMQAAWAAFLIFSESFAQILAMVSLSMLVIGGLTVASLFLLRRNEPNTPRPFRAFGYPWLPLIYLAANALVTFVIVAGAFAGDSKQLYALLGLGILLVAYLGHRLFRARVGPTRSSQSVGPDRSFGVSKGWR